jgi:hypothetical protein
MFLRANDSGDLGLALSLRMNGRWRIPMVILISNQGNPTLEKRANASSEVLPHVFNCLLCHPTDRMHPRPLFSGSQHVNPSLTIILSPAIPGITPETIKKGENHG